jgi:hypothetical protein
MEIEYVWCFWFSMAASILTTYRMHARASPIQTGVFSTRFRCGILIVVVVFSRTFRCAASTGAIWIPDGSTAP